LRVLREAWPYSFLAALQQDGGMKLRVGLTLLGLQFAFVPEGVNAQEAAAVAHWKDGPVSRLEALALLETLNADLLSHDSATLVLEDWCRSHNLAASSRVTAQRVANAHKEPSSAQRKLLDVAADEPVRYRRVLLSCGRHVLSEADNWYVPSRLTDAMNRELDTTDVAFGRAVQALNFRRRTLSAALLWSPLPMHWETAAPDADTAKAGGTLSVPDHVLRHHAILTLPDGTPFSEVVETYTSEILNFRQPALH
jgi:chorismate-pyruvate lyase